MKKLYVLFLLLITVFASGNAQQKRIRLTTADGVEKNGVEILPYCSLPPYMIEFNLSKDNLIIHSKATGTISLSRNLSIHIEKRDGLVLCFVFDKNSTVNGEYTKGFAYAKRADNGPKKPCKQMFSIITSEGSYDWRNCSLLFEEYKNGWNQNGQADQNLAYSTIDNDRFIRFIKELQNY